jgi:hypothetical protein
VNGLTAAVVPAKPGHVLVEDEQRAVSVDELQEAPQEIVCRRFGTFGLEDEARDAAGMCREKVLD